MKSYSLYKSMVTIAFLLTVVLAVLLYFHLTSVQQGDNNWANNAIWGIILLAFVLFAVGWKLILDAYSKASLEKEQNTAITNPNQEDTTTQNQLHIDFFIDKIKNDLSSTKTEEFYSQLLSIISRTLEFDSALAFKENKGSYEHTADWAFHQDRFPEAFQLGEGLNGQAAKEGRCMMLNNLPESYFLILSGSGQSSPKSLYILPLMKEEKCIAVLEFASLKEGNTEIKSVLEQLNKTIVELSEKLS